MLIISLSCIFFILLLLSLITNHKFSYLQTLMIFIGLITTGSLVAHLLHIEFSFTVILTPILLLTLLIFRKKLHVNFKIIKEYLISIIVSFALLYFINNYFYGLDLNEFEALNSHFNTLLNVYYFDSISINFLDYFFIDLLQLLPNNITSIQLINQYTNLALFTFYFLFTTFIFEISKLTEQLNNNLTYILIFTLYFVSLPGLAHNFLHSLWLIIPITCIYHLLNDVKSNIINCIVCLLFGLTINPFWFLISLIIILIIHKKTPLIYRNVIFVGLLIIALIYNPTQGVSLLDQLISNSDNTLLPLFYLNRKQIVITISFLSMLVINIFNTKKTNNKLSNIFMVILVIYLLFLENTCILYILMLVIINPLNFIQQISQFVELSLKSFINVNNIPIILGLFSIWLVSFSLNFNPFEISNKSKRCIYLDIETNQIVDYLNFNYPIDTSVSSELLSIHSFMPISDTSDNAQVLIIRKNRKKVVKGNYSLKFETDNYYIFEKY